MTFVLHWRRDGSAARSELIDRLPVSLTRLRDEPVSTWARGPLTILSFEHSPGLSIAESPAGFVALLNGRLDDFPNLVARLGGAAVLGREPTDAEVLAAAYEKWGERCFEQLVGDFAAVIWEPARRSLLCARDVVGIAPLYYWSDEEEVMLAGHLGGVVSHPKVRREPNEGYIAEVLADDIHSRHETLYDSVWRLVAGHACRFDRTGSTQTWRWGTIEPLDLPSNLSDAEYDDQYRHLLTQSIRDRMRAPAKVGVELSGGLDSSSIAVLAAPLAHRLYGEPLRTYSLTFPGMACDETPYIRAVATKPLMEATLVAGPTADGARLQTEPSETLTVPDLPNGIAFRVLLATGQQAGVTVLLTGQGGDQWFYNQPSFPAFLASRGRLTKAWSTARRLSPKQSPSLAFLHHVMRPIAGGLIRKAAPGWRVAQPPSWLAPDLVRRTDFLDRTRLDAAGVPSPRRDRQRFCESGWEAHVFETGALSAQRLGGDFRHPYYDVRLVRFALGLDESHRWADGQFRTIQRRALRGTLPAVIANRTSKADFSHLFVEQLKCAGGASLMRALRIARDREWVLGAQLDRMYAEMKRDVENGVSPRHLWPLWHTVAVESWYKAVVCASGPATRQ